jgi:DNA-binding transcriptional LysR family regulator
VRGSSTAARKVSSRPNTGGRCCGVAVFDELKQGVRDIAFLSDPGTGELQIGASAASSEGIVAAVIDRLAQQYPRVVFHVVVGGTLALLEGLRARRVEIGFVRRRRRRRMSCLRSRWWSWRARRVHGFATARSTCINLNGRHVLATGWTTRRDYHALRPIWPTPTKESGPVPASIDHLAVD